MIVLGETSHFLRTNHSSIFQLPHLPQQNSQTKLVHPQQKQVFSPFQKTIKTTQSFVVHLVKPLAHFYAFKLAISRENGPNMHSAFESQTSHDSRSHKSLTCLKHWKIAIEHHVCFFKNWVHESNHLFKKNETTFFQKWKPVPFQYMKSCHLASCIHPGYQPYQLHRSTPFREHKTAAARFPFVTVRCWMKLIPNMLLKCNLCKLFSCWNQIQLNVLRFGALA